MTTDDQLENKNQYNNETNDSLISYSRIIVIQKFDLKKVII